MVRPIAILGTLVLLAACAAGAWRAAHPSSALFVVPGATNVRVTSNTWGEQQITYDAPGPSYAWYFKLRRDLTARGWTAVHIFSDPYLDPLNTGIYRRVISRRIVVVWERVSMRGGPNTPQITVRRRIMIPALRLVW